MKRPNVPAMDDLEAVIKDLYETEEAMQTLRARLDEVVREIAMQAKEGSELIDTMTYLYWMVPEVKSVSIAKAFLGEPNLHKLLEVVSPIEAGLHCERCGRQLQFSSRTKLKQSQVELKKKYPRWAEGYKLVCNTCKEEIFAERQIEYECQRAAYRARLDELRRMPYREYLQTPEWQARRKQHLRSAGYRCQVCNASGRRLDVHHRTYEHRGEETFKDLIVLCEDCHQLFHSEGKLAED